MLQDLKKKKVFLFYNECKINAPSNGHIFIFFCLIIDFSGWRSFKFFNYGMVFQFHRRNTNFYICCWKYCTVQVQIWNRGKHNQSFTFDCELHSYRIGCNSYDSSRCSLICDILLLDTVCTWQHFHFECYKLKVQMSFKIEKLSV